MLNETHNYITILYGDFLYQISSKSLKKYANYGWKFIYALIV